MIVAASDRRACRDLLRTGSRSFFAASHLLPHAVREPATALYAFCRLADDAVDLEAAARGDRRAAIQRLGERLDRAYRGAPLALSADRAFAETVRRFDMPRALPEALLEGLAWDAEGRRYATFSDLRAYAARVAGAVGAMMAVVMGVRDRDALARACDLGAAMQLTNIARDIGEDAREGRLYLPMDWMRDAGLDPEDWLASPRFTPALGRIVERLLDEADKLYALGEAGIVALPLRCRPGIRAARYLYAEIGHELRRNNCDSVTARTVVPKARQLALLARAAAPSIRANRDLAGRPAQAEARFLLDAVVTPAATRPRARLSDQVLWTLDLFDRIEQRRAGRQLEGGA